MKPRGKKIERKCACCGEAFIARVADVNRGWARFCSKSCKATIQSWNQYNDRMCGYDQSWDAHKGGR